MVLTKTDLAPARAAQALRARLTAINISAPVLEGVAIGADGETLLVDDIYDAQGKAREIFRWNWA